MSRFQSRTAHIRFVGTNADILKGSGTGSPVSGWIEELTTTLSSVLRCRVGGSSRIKDGVNHVRQPTLLRVPILVPLFQVDQVSLVPRRLDEALELRDVRLSIFQGFRRGEKS